MKAINNSDPAPAGPSTKEKAAFESLSTFITKNAGYGVWENNNNNFSAASQRTAEIKVPVAVTVFPGDIYRAPKSWAERAYPKLIYFNEVDKGGHFAAWEQPQLFSEESRVAFRSLR